MKVQPPGSPLSVAITLVAIGASAQTFVYSAEHRVSKFSAFSGQRGNGGADAIANSPFPRAAHRRS